MKQKRKKSFTFEVSGKYSPQLVVNIFMRKSTQDF